MRDYRYFLPQMRAHRRSKRSREWLSNNKELVDQVLARIHEQGGLRAADFEAPEDFVRGAWWSRKPQKVALELLFERGDLMISAREGFQRRYDLRERVLPSWVDLTEPTPEETGRHLALQNLCRMGLVQERDMTLPRLHRKAVSLALADMLSSGEVMQVQIQGLDGEPYLCLADALSGADEPDDKAHILSPFDPLTIQRRWLRALFDLDYALECYLPAAKRVHGYFSLPVLWRDRFVGRIDAKADRQPGKLLLKHLELEEPHELSDAFLRALSAACWRFAAFNGCGEICVQRGTPVEAADALQKALGAHGQA